MAGLKVAKRFGSVAAVLLCFSPAQVLAGEPVRGDEFFGISYGPFRDGQSPVTGVFPNLEEVEADLAILSGMTGRIWFYSSSIENGYTEFVRAAARAPFNLEVVSTAYLNPENDDWGARVNDNEIAGLIDLVNDTETPLWMASVGSEAITSGYMDARDVIRRLDQVRNATEGSGVRLTTSENWHVWLKNPELVEHVDVISATVYAFWDEQPIDLAVEYTLSILSMLRDEYPDKPIVVSEVGWPSDGTPKGPAVPSVQNAAQFCRGMKAAFQKGGIAAFHFSFADERWKEKMEPLGVGSHFGFVIGDRTTKFDC